MSMHVGARVRAFCLAPLAAVPSTVCDLAFVTLQLCAAWGGCLPVQQSVGWGLDQTLTDFVFMPQRVLLR